MPPSLAPDGPPSTPPGAIPTVAWIPDPGAADGTPGAVALLDQTRLPSAAVELRCRDAETVREAIRRLAVRGAPAIGVAGAYGLVAGMQGAYAAGVPSPAAFAEALARTVETIRTARPTAVNLAWAVDRCVGAIAGLPPEGALRRLLAEARAIHAEDEAACLAMGRHAASLLPPDGTFLTHCNTGRLATAGCGTAFAAFATLAHRGHRPTVHVGEVRPLLQGARLTAFELAERGIPCRLHPDTAAGALLATGRIDAVLVGADRIARNGDAANKIGTYTLAVLARTHGVPFYVVAPTSTLDPSIADGTGIPIEERGPDEVRGFGGVRTAPEGVPVWNPAFDVTPAPLVSAIVTERGIFRGPYRF